MNVLTPAIGLIATEKKYEGAENRVNTWTNLAP